MWNFFILPVLGVCFCRSQNADGNLQADSKTVKMLPSGVSGFNPG
jgi:hypothetical protein